MPNLAALQPFRNGRSPERPSSQIRSNPPGSGRDWRRVRARKDSGQAVGLKTVAKKVLPIHHSIAQSTPTISAMPSKSATASQANAPGTPDHGRRLKNGAQAHNFTREDRARGGRARAEKIRTRKALQERFEVEALEGLNGAESELLDRALVRLALLVASEDDRIAMRACREVFDRVLGRPSPRADRGEVTGARPSLKAEAAAAREKLAILIDRRAQELAATRGCDHS
jgi:hypothetical protein